MATIKGVNSCLTNREIVPSTRLTYCRINDQLVRLR